MWRRADCGDLRDPTWWSTVEPEELVAELAFRDLGDRNYEHEHFLPLHPAIYFPKMNKVRFW